MSTTISVQQQAGVARIVFASENGIQILNSGVRAELQRVLEALNANDDCRVVVFSATGRTFIAGADIRELHALDQRSAYEFAREGQLLFQRIADLRAVSISAIHAACAGGGCELSLACDMRLAATSARIGLPEVTLGLIPGWGGTVRATQLLGAAVSRRVMLTGELLTAELALRLGLVDDVFPDDRFAEGVEARIAQVLRGGPHALATAKALIDDLPGVDIDGLLRQEAAQFAACYATNQAREGLAAFLAKRTAPWDPAPQRR